MAKPLQKWVVTCPYAAKSTRWLGGIHKGIDGRAAIGTPVYATTAGTVLDKSWGRSFGNHVVVANNRFADGYPGLFSGYCHLSKVVVKPGQKVRKGQLIGYSGASGNVTAPHLHYEIQRLATWSRTGHVNPARWINA